MTKINSFCFEWLPLDLMPPEPLLQFAKLFISPMILKQCLNNLLELTLLQLSHLALKNIESNALQI